ncbi:PadR family transcriptional regulator [Bacillus sp. BRMEA1]|uniref:PadR family transcriptional regulator n=1 Tax=Neobacillus endophyticus TaxID=2738405 RepID=UPI001566D637|nr:PadR family transcriptional regulator [Neobacillus endophyticus]NRD78477.1 PadR family transcriptional regulator [Neobacillus endophyticus]NRD80208.1 PadR family transcriptional regulator [Neobacillus endophyticus]
MNPLSESTYLILLALYHEPLHGYGIIKSIEEVSNGSFIIAPGTLYGVLNNLQKQRLIETVKQEEDSRKKKTYAITEKGKEILHLEFNRFQKMITFTEKIMEERI